MVIHAFFRRETISGIVFQPLIHTAGKDNGTSIGVNDFLNIGGSPFLASSIPWRRRGIELHL